MNNPPKIRLVIADDHDMIIDGLMALLANEQDIQVVGRANNGKLLLNVLKNKPVDLVVLDIDMPEMNGVEACEAIKKSYPSIKILVLTMYNTPSFITQVISHGADGYILKNTRKKELTDGIRTVMAGKPFYTSAVTSTIMSSFKQSHSTEKEVELTNREKDIIRLICNEMTSREIGQQLFISHHTVERHRKNIIAKLGVKNVAGLVKYALKKGLVE